MQHSNEVINMGGGHVGKLAAELFAAFAYGIIFGVPISAIVGLAASVAYSIYGLAKLRADKSEQQN